jgi:carbamoyl-phosphate synthase large subunit
VKKKIKTLVTGISSGVGQSIYKSLLLSKLNLDIYVGDINFFNIGLCQSKKYLILPRVEEKNFLEQIIKILKKNKIDILFVGSEYDIDFLSKYKDYINIKTGTLVSLSSNNIIKKFSDKFEMVKILKKNQILYPKTFEFNIQNLKKNNYKFPLILKNKTGTSSKEVFIIKSLQELKSRAMLLKKPIVQEYIGDLENNFQEFTCSFFKTKEAKILGPFLGQRTLKFGTSWIFEKIENKSLKKLIIKISKLDNFEGSINIQLRYHKKKFIPFEINPRYSGTTILRSLQGFNEPEMYIKNFFLNKKIDNPKIKKKGVYFRYIGEKLVTHNNIKKIKYNNYKS